MRVEFEQQRRKMKPIVKTIVKIFAVLLILAGGVWTLQGLNLLPGTFMRGNPQWVINGIITILIGVGLLWFANRKNNHA
jgi:hypothetical protein